MIDPRYTQPLYDALNQLLEATCYIDVQEVGGQPLNDAWNEADKLQQEIDQVSLDPARVCLTRSSLPRIAKKGFLC